MRFNKITILLGIVCILVIVVGVLFFMLFRSIMKEPDETTAFPTPTQIPTPTPTFIPLEVKGSIPYWDQKNAIVSFQANTSSFNYINVFWYFLTANGTIKKYTDATEDLSLITYAHSNNVKVMAVLTNLPEEEGTTWNSQRVERAIQTKVARQRHIIGIIDLLKQKNFDGVTIDYEQVDSSLKNSFSLFINELSIAMKSEGKILAVALHPKTGAAKKGESIGAFQDWKALSLSADHLNIMAYGEHWDEGSSGPIASTPWVEKIIAYVESINAPKEKFFLGVPLYGYDWNKDNDEPAEGLTFFGVQKLLTEFNAEEDWDPKQSSPYFYYEDEDGDEHEVWFENARSVKEKTDLAIKAGFGGITFWRLGEEDKVVWNIFR